MSLEVVKTEYRQAADFPGCFPVQKATLVILDMNNNHHLFQV